MSRSRIHRHVSDAGCFASDSELEQLVRIDLVGLPGNDGRDGQSYLAPSRRPGRSGRRGGDATPADPGFDGGDLSISLSYSHPDRSLQVLLLEGTIHPCRKRKTHFVHEAKFDQPGYVFIDAPGGEGGHGGRGGDGQPGARGSNGSNATRFTSGGDGGPGGRGGDAGNPTDGACGGAGGDVSLSVNENDLGLLMLVKGHLAGGDLGFAGRAGRGGRGGKGGSGGSSYHWTETDHYTDSDGNRRTRRTSHSNPGGSDGRRGRDGASSAYRARDGLSGVPGQFQINVVRNDGSQSLYPAPFDLELVTFDVASEYQVLEPDSVLSVDRLVIRNCGAMPTPANYTVRVQLPSDRWIESDHVDLVLHQSLAPGETFTFENHGLRFRVADFVIDEPRRRPFAVKHPVSPSASLESGIHRPFRQFESPEDMRFTFPIELAPVRSLRSLAPGESTRVIWGITNTGTETFKKSTVDRAVRARMGVMDGDIDLGHLAFFDHRDHPQDLVKQFQLEIRELKPGETHHIETRIGVRRTESIVSYQGFALNADADLQRPESSERAGQYRCVDSRKCFIRIAERYRRDEGSRFLLVANQKTTSDDIDKWTQLADYFGSGLDVWDVSYYGFFDLARAVDRDKSLLQQWRGMTIIVPNNYFETPDGMVVALEQLAKSQFLEAAADHDINFYFVGDSRTGGAEMLESCLFPTGDTEPSPLRSSKEFFRELHRWNDYVRRSQDVLGGDTKDAQDLADVSLGAVHHLDVSKRTFLFQPTRSWLLQQGARLQAKLRKVDPLHRWIVVHRYDDGDTDTSWGLFRKRQVGRLDLYRSLDSTKGSAVLYEVDGIDAIDEGFINSRENKHGIFLALKFEDKVDRFVRLVSERTFPRYSEDYVDRPLSDEEVGEIGKELVDSILTDLYNEQRVARHSKTWGPRHVRSLMPKLNYLAERALNYGLTYKQMQKNQVTLDLLFDLIVHIRYMAHRSLSVWDSNWNPASIFKRSRAVTAHMMERTDRVVTSIFGRRLGWWDRMTSSGDDAFGSSKEGQQDRNAREHADELLQQREAELFRGNRKLSRYGSAQDHPGLTYDPELLPKGTRVLSGKQFDELVAKEQLAEQRRAAVEQAVKKNRSDMLVPLDHSTPLAVGTSVTASRTPG